MAVKVGAAGTPSTRAQQAGAGSSRVAMAVTVDGWQRPRLGRRPEASRW
ncbi:MAG: hypothetical protein H0U41_06600 [Actinobacteria bacterium]|nr:hypothetical protein [Actinomycetota bacterium]